MLNFYLFIFRYFCFVLTMACHLSRDNEITMRGSSCHNAAEQGCIRANPVAQPNPGSE